MMQRDIFLEGEGDAWFERNRDRRRTMRFPGVQELLALGRRFRATLEIGCGDGRRLLALSHMIGGEFHGIDPSQRAVEAGAEDAPKWRPLHLVRGTADSLPYDAGAFDLVIFGFCLYLCDREDLFRIAAEADRVLEDGGFLVIHDFHARPHRNPYRHRAGVQSFKMDYAAMFLWNPAYSLVSQSVLSESGAGLPLGPGDAAAITILKKDMARAYPEHRDPAVEPDMDEAWPDHLHPPRLLETA